MFKKKKLLPIEKLFISATKLSTNDLPIFFYNFTSFLYYSSKEFLAYVHSTRRLAIARSARVAFA